jgi:hypothetical protein
MVLMTRPDGGQTWVHESRVEEYRGRGFTVPGDPVKDEKAEPTVAKKKTTTRKK